MAGSNVKVEEVAERTTPKQTTDEVTHSIVGEETELHRTIQDLVDTRLSSIERALEGLTGIGDRLATDLDPAPPEPMQPSPRPVATIPGPATPVPASSAREPQWNERALLEQAPRTPRTERILVAWVSALLDDVGDVGLPEALALLESSGWISTPVRIRMARLAAGMQAATPTVAMGRRLSRVALERSLAAIEEIQGTR